jgi:hypothetical protein
MPLFDHMDNLLSPDGANGVLPLTERPALPVINPDMALSMGEDFWSSLLPEIAGRNAEALYYFLTGSSLEEDTEITEGHAHDSELTALEWQQLGVWTWSERESASSTIAAVPATDGGFVVTSTAYPSVPHMAGSFVLRRGIDWIYPRVRVQDCLEARLLNVKVELYDESAGGNVVDITVPLASLEAHIVVATGQSYFVFPPIDVTGWFENGTPARRHIHAFWWAKVASAVAPCEVVESQFSFKAGG